QYITCFLLFIIIACSITFAQTDSSYLKTEEVLEDILQNPEGEIDESDLYDILEQLMLNPINLNSASVDELTRIPEVDISDARLIVSHRNKYGNFFSLSELNAVVDLNKELVKRITPFLYVEQKQTVDETEPEKTSAFISQTKLLLRSRIINSLQTSEGFNENKYDGSKPRVYNRLLLKYSNNFQAGILAEKDPGESSFNEFTTYHLAINDVGFIYKAVVMDYYLEFGQGLTMWSPYAFSKGPDAIYPVKRIDKISKPYTSAGENNFFRGVTASFKLDDFMITGFYSDNSFDANIDSLTGEITSTPVDGLHRTPTELVKRKSASEQMLGGRVDYDFKNFLHLGVLHYQSIFSNAFQPSGIYDLSGDDFRYSAFAYDFTLNKFDLTGEFSYNGTSVASINILQLLINDSFTFIASFRNYPSNFFSLHGYAFGERNGATRNEVGIYTGFKWRTSLGILNFYYDQFKFPFATFYEPNPSNGDEYLIDFLTKPMNKFELRLRYKYENKDVTEPIENTKQIVNRIKRAIRGEIIYSISNKIRLRGRFEYASFDISTTDQNENGYLIYQDIRYSPTNNLNLYGRI
ncbi:MAG TPA: helix-hairpin-helix domain-containing protein, partial [Ignavibacteriaceae bacterium]